MRDAVAAVLEADAEDDEVPTVLVVANVWEATWVIDDVDVVEVLLPSTESVNRTVKDAVTSALCVDSTEFDSVTWSVCVLNADAVWSDGDAESDIVVVCEIL